MTEPTYEAAIIGAGPGGISAAHLLRLKGITNFVILERAADFGGTWRDNHYPGLAVDIPALWYQLSFAPNAGWSRLFAPGPELYRYLQDTARRLGLYEHLQANAEVLQQKWDDDARFWRLRIRDHPELTARFLISSVGGYVNAKATVDIDGIDDFEGEILRPNVLPKIDFDIPRLMRCILRMPGVVGGVNVAGRLAMDVFMVTPIVHLFSRLPDSVLARVMAFYDMYCRALYRLLLRAVVHDPAIRKALVPHYGIMAKRPVISSSFLPALNNPTTNLITTPIERITRSGVRTVDGVDHPADLLVLATGYELWTDPEAYRPGTVLGPNGFNLAEFYRAHGLQSYAGTAHYRLPNRWEIVGPLGFVGFAWMDFVETMAAHAVRMIEEARRRDITVVAVSQDAFNRWNTVMRRRGNAAHLYYTASAGLNTYFINSQRDTLYYRPQTITGSCRFARSSPLSDYEFSRRTAPITPLAKELSA